MNTLKDLEQWYQTQCNEDWEHTYGIRISNIDNPGWSVEVELADTSIEDKEYKEYSYGVGTEAENSGANWLITKKEKGIFIGLGGPEKLDEIIKIFLQWASTE